MTALQAKRMMRHARDMHRNAVDDGRTQDAGLAYLVWLDAARAYVVAMRGARG